MSFYSHWQPLRDEDAHTALLFGFLRHAPTEAALDEWLTYVLGRPAKGLPLTPQSFWPNLASRLPGSTYTEPELVFDADDGAPLTVVVEVKPGYDMHALEQIMREVIDTANTRRPSRLACVMVGADLARPTTTELWLEETARAVKEYVPFPVEVELHYSSFASLGLAIAQCGRSKPDWANYADDAVAQLRRKGLLGYEGAPMLDDLEGLTISSAVEAFNRTIRAARQFYLLLHTQSDFAALELEPLHWNFRMIRNGGSDVITQTEAWFETTAILSQYRHKSFADGSAAFVGFDLIGGGSDPDILVGLGGTQEGTYRFAEAIRAGERLHEDGGFRERAVAGKCEWLYTRRPWRAGSAADEDIAWTIGQLAALLGAGPDPGTATGP